MLLFYVLVAVGSFFLSTVDCQPKCSVGLFPSVLPLISNQSLPIDLNDYFQGSNLTFHLSSPDSSLTLSPKYTLQTTSHNLGAILSISSSAEIFTVLFHWLRCWGGLLQANTLYTTLQLKIFKLWVHANYQQQSLPVWTIQFRQIPWL